MASSTVASPIPVGEILAGKYRIERVLGAGGMGVVVAATHLELDQKVAIKFVLPSATDADTMIRFTREARALAKVESEHVARVMDVGTLGDGTPYMVMEYLEGSDLARLVRERGPIALADAIDWLLETCDAVSAAHAAGIVHRDLKPANLFLTRRRTGRGAIKVLDFGISKSFGAAQDDLALTKTATILGSPLYMAPEQIRESRDVDVRADIWALGVIFYELTTGVVPFDAESLPALIAKITSSTPLAAHERLSTLPIEVTTLTSRCLEKDPDDRYRSVDDLAAALRRIPKPMVDVHASMASATPQEPSSLAASVEAPSTGPPSFPRTEVLPLAEKSSTPSRREPRATRERSKVAMPAAVALVVVGVTVLAIWGSVADPKPPRDVTIGSAGSQMANTGPAPLDTRPSPAPSMSSSNVAPAVNVAPNVPVAMPRTKPQAPTSSAPRSTAANDASTPASVPPPSPSPRPPASEKLL